MTGKSSELPTKLYDCLKKWDKEDFIHSKIMFTLVNIQLILITVTVQVELIQLIWLCESKNLDPFLKYANEICEELS